MAQTDYDQRQQHRQEYEHVLRMIEYNTGGPQPAMMDFRSLMTIVRHSTLEGEDALDRLQIAQDRGEIITYQTDCLRVALATEESLRAIIEEQAASEHPDEELIGECNKRRQELRGESA